MHKHYIDEAPCRLLTTLRKLKTTMPSLKPKVVKHLRSGTVYQITNHPSCPDLIQGAQCTISTSQQAFQTLWGETQLWQYGHFEIIGAQGTPPFNTGSPVYRGEEVLHNTKEEYRSRKLTARLYWICFNLSCRIIEHWQTDNWLAL